MIKYIKEFEKEINQVAIDESQYYDQSLRDREVAVKAFENGANWMLRKLNPIKNKIIVYKDGSYLLSEQSWEYENDPQWLATIDTTTLKN